MDDDRPPRWKHYGSKEGSYDHDEDGEPSVGALRRAHEDARDVLSEHLKVFSEQAEKAGRMVQTNGAILTVFVYISASSQTSDFIEFFNCFSIPGLLFLFGGTIVGLREQTSQEVKAGVSSQEFRVIENNNLSEKGYLRWILKSGYSDWIDQAGTDTERKASRVKVCIVVSIVGILLLFAGIFLAVQ